jgi:hypothetical protein
MQSLINTELEAREIYLLNGPYIYLTAYNNMGQNKLWMWTG